MVLLLQWLVVVLMSSILSAVCCSSSLECRLYQTFCVPGQGISISINSTAAPGICTNSLTSLGRAGSITCSSIATITTVTICFIVKSSSSSSISTCTGSSLATASCSSTASVICWAALYRNRRGCERVRSRYQRIQPGLLPLLLLLLLGPVLLQQRPQLTLAAQVCGQCDSQRAIWLQHLEGLESIVLMLHAPELLECPLAEPKQGGLRQGQ